MSRVLKYGGRVRTGSEPGQAETPAHHAARKTAMGVGAVDHTRFGEVVVRRGRTRGQNRHLFCTGVPPRNSQCCLS